MMDSTYAYIILIRKVMAAVADRRCLDGGARTVPAWTFPPLPKKITRLCNAFSIDDRVLLVM